MTSVVDIYNRALAEAGTRSSVQSTSEDSAEARVCNIFYDAVRQTVLRMAPWGSVRKFTTLGLLKAVPGTPENTGAATETWVATDPPPPWSYAYAYPSDAIFIRYVMAQPYQAPSVAPIFPIGTGLQRTVPPMKFIISSDLDSEGNVRKIIATDAERAIACYNADLGPDMWDPFLTECVVFGLAGKICLDLNGKMKLQQVLYARANQMALEARAADANEGLTINDHVPDWIAARESAGINPYWNPYYNNYGPLFPTGQGGLS